MRRRFLFAAYSAAGISFLAALLRDYAVINFTSQDKQFFQLFYVVSMAAGFGVNAIALGVGSLGKMALAILSLLGVLVIIVMLPASSATFYSYSLLFAILLMWIAGAQWSRVLIEQGWVFSGRIREAISSFLMAGLVVAGLSAEPSFLVAVAAGTVFSWGMWKVIRLPAAIPVNSGSSLLMIGKLTQSIILTNASTFSITYWALMQTGKEGSIFGYDISTAVRFSMYLYQILIIGSVVIVSLKSNSTYDYKHLRLLVLVAILVFLLSLFAPLQAALVLVPLSAAVIHYGIVISLQKRA